MDTIRDIWKSWIGFWFKPADPTPLAVIRITTGLCMLYTLAVYSLDLQAFFGEKGFYDLATINRERKETPVFILPYDTWDDGIRTSRLPDPPHRRAAVLAYVKSLADTPKMEREQKLRYLIFLQNQANTDNALSGLDMVLNYISIDPTVRNARLQAIINEAVRQDFDSGKIPDFIKQLPAKGEPSRESVAADINAFFLSLPADKEFRDFTLNYFMEIGTVQRGLLLDFLRTLPEDKKERDEAIEYLSYWNVEKRSVNRFGKPIFSIWFHVTSKTGMAVAHGVIIGIFVLFTLGLFTRVTSVLAWLAAVGYIHRIQYVQFGMDTMSNILLIYLMIGNSGGALSLDRLRERYRAIRHSLKTNGAVSDGCKSFLSKPTPTVGSGVALRLMQIHFCIIYMAAGLSKLKGTGWWTHNAFWDIIANPEFTMLNYSWYEQLLQWMANNRPIYALAALSMIVITFTAELCLPFLVWTKARPYIVTVGIFLHVGIALTMGLTLFSLLMMTFLVSYLPAQAFNPRFFNTSVNNTAIKFNPDSEVHCKAVAKALALDTDGTLALIPDKTLPATSELALRHAWGASSVGWWLKWLVK